jgi:hypothetical protein
LPRLDRARGFRSRLRRATPARQRANAFAESAFCPLGILKWVPYAATCRSNAASALYLARRSIDPRLPLGRRAIPRYAPKPKSTPCCSAPSAARCWLAASHDSTATSKFLCRSRSHCSSFRGLPPFGWLEPTPHVDRLLGARQPSLRASDTIKPAPPFECSPPLRAHEPWKLW